MTDSVLDYEAEVTRLVKEYVSGETTTFFFLASALGCRVNDDEYGHTIPPAGYIRLPIQPDFAHDALIRRSLLEALRRHASRDAFFSDNGYSLLDGLVRQDRWRECLTNIEDAHAFAGLLLEFSFAADVTVAPYGAALRKAITPDVCYALKEWLPSIDCLANDLFPPFEVLARALFGAVWCDMILPEADIRRYNCGLAMRAFQPPFLPGLLPEYVAHTIEVLPNLETP